jgi:outer membrane protein TolC
MRTILLITALAPGIALAQLGSRSSSGSTSVASQLPLSGRTAETGSATAAQTPIPGATTSVNAINTTVQVSGPYAGSSPSTLKRPFNGKLSFREAIQRALEFNLGSIGLSTAVRQARGQAVVSRSNLLPNLSGAFSEHYLTTDIATTGIQGAIGNAIGSSLTNATGGRPLSLRLPNVVGPINYFDLRVTLTQNFVDLTALNNYRSSKYVVEANEAAMQDTRDTVVLAVGASYLQVIAAKARVASERAQLETSDAVYQQTLKRRGEGLAAQLDLNQDRVRAQTERQRLATMENDLYRQKINLARLTGLPPNEDYDISDDFGFSPAPALSVNEAVEQALGGRADLKAAEAQLRAAEKTLAAARAERLPSLSLSADLGEIGTRFSQADHTYTVTGTLNIPIWQGGRVRGDIEQAQAALDQRRAELADMRARIESDVRNAYLDLQAAASQFELSKNNQQVARENLRLTQEKFETGISDSVEVSQSRQAVASADLDYITALFAHNLAKLSLARALGGAEGRLGEYLGRDLSASNRGNTDTVPAVPNALTAAK